MLYLIGGSPRTGKTILSTRLLERNKVTFVSTDSLVYMLQKAAPQLGISEGPDLQFKAEKLYPFIEQFIDCNRYVSEDFTVEGDAIWPKQVDDLKKKYNLRVCFLGLSKIDLETLQKYIGLNDWLLDLSEEELKNTPTWITETSQNIKDECEKYGFKYLDVSENFSEKIEEAYQYLTSNISK